jgi:TonB-linked SusC/RagA family outer membrane protein
MNRRSHIHRACGAASLMLGLLLTNGVPSAVAAPSTLLYNVRQQREISGTVRDAKGNPLPGVTVSLKNSNKGTKTDVNGFYRIAANPGDVLMFTFIGFTTQEQIVGANANISLALQEDVRGLNELVVTALGIRKEARSNGYAVSTVQGGEMTKAREISVANALEGRVAGVNSTPPTTGPGGSSRLTIRGASSLTGTNQPLYVINGIPMDNTQLGNAGEYGGPDLGDGMSSINPDDIESLTILKGGAASALYGQRGINGVVLITTKSGKAGVMSVEWNSNATVEKANNFLDFQEVYGQGLKGSRPTDVASAMEAGLSSWGEKLDGKPSVMFDGKQHPYSKQDDHIKDFYKTGASFSNTLAVSGGNDNTTYRVALGDLRTNGIYPNTQYIRNNVNIDVNYKLSAKWSGQTNITYAKEITNNRSNLSDAPGNGNFSIAFMPANMNDHYLLPYMDGRKYEIPFTKDYFSTNPYFAAYRFINNTQKNRVLAVSSLRYSPLSWLYIQARVANDNYGFNATQITPTGTAYRPLGSIDNEIDIQFNEMNADVLIGINKDLSPKLHLDVNAGANQQQRDLKKNDVTASQFAFPFVYNPSSAAVKNSTITDTKKDVNSVYGSAELSWNNTVYLNVTDRNDWSSTLPLVNNSYNYPSANISYVFSETLKQDWLSFGKLRAGYAQVGGDAPEYSTALYYSTLGSTLNGAPLGDIDNKIPNKNIKPLTAKELEVGAELKLFNNRLFADFSWYSKKVTNDIVTASTSLGSGYTTAVINVGELQNKGVELLLGGTPVKTANFNWTTSVNFADNQNKVLALAPGQVYLQIPDAISRTGFAYVDDVVGKPFAQVMAFDYKKDAKGNLVLNASGLPEPSDALSAKGTGVAPITGGWNNDFAYKHFHLAFLIDFKTGGVIYSGTNANAYLYGLHKETLKGREGGITVTGVDESGAAMTKNVDAQTYYGQLESISAVNVYKSDFIKFRSLSLTYDFDKQLLNNKLHGVSISLVARNLFYIKKSTPNIDPESNYSASNGQGLEYAGLPSTKTFGLNLNVKF